MDALNSNVLTVIALLFMLLYVAVVVTGFRDLVSRRPNRGSRVKRSQNHTALRDSRNAKRTK